MLYMLVWLGSNYIGKPLRRRRTKYQPSPHWLRIISHEDMRDQSSCYKLEYLAKVNKFVGAT
jgi:hypothetical protein